MKELLVYGACVPVPSTATRLKSQKPFHFDIIATNIQHNMYSLQISQTWPMVLPLLHPIYCHGYVIHTGTYCIQYIPKSLLSSQELYNIFSPSNHWKCWKTFSNVKRLKHVLSMPELANCLFQQIVIHFNFSVSHLHLSALLSRDQSNLLIHFKMISLLQQINR